MSISTSSVSILYTQIFNLPGSYVLGVAELLLGEFDVHRAGEVMKLRRQEQKKQFMALLAAHLVESPL